MSKPIINIRRADNTSALFDFKSGVKSMDDFIQDQEKGLSKFIELGLSNLWPVYEGEKVVAFFALSKDALILNSEDARTITGDKRLSNLLPSKEETKFWEQEKYPAIEIDYLAVCEEKRKEPGEHLGTAIVGKILDFAAHDRLSATKFITVEALDTKEYSAVNFYRQHCDFEFSEVGKLHNLNKMFNGEQPTTQRMYRVVIPLETVNDE